MKMKLAKRFDECPKIWQHLIVSLQSDPYEAVSTDCINLALAKFDAVYTDRKGFPSAGYVTFSTTGNYVMFALRYSS
jgi:hypothetical protein